MKTSVSFLHWLTLALAIAAVAFAALYFSQAEAVESRPVGSISITNFIPNEGNGTESFQLSFSGVLSTTSTADLDGWKILSETGLVMDLSEVELTNEGSIKFCEDGSVDTNCDYFFVGSDMFNNQMGELHLVADTGLPIAFITYENPAVGETFNGSGSYIDDVYGSGDKVTICEMQKNGALKERTINVVPLVNAMETDLAEQVAIIPPFVYEIKKSLGYHPGVNWPAGAAQLAGGCQ